MIPFSSDWIRKTFRMCQVWLAAQLLFAAFVEERHVFHAFMHCRGIPCKFGPSDLLGKLLRRLVCVSPRIVCKTAPPTQRGGGGGRVSAPPPFLGRDEPLPSPDVPRLSIGRSGTFLERTRRIGRSRRPPTVSWVEPPSFAPLMDFLDQEAFLIPFLGPIE